MSEKRVVAYILPTAWEKGRGHRVSFVTEGEAGHSPNGNTPEGGQVEPWYWGHETDAAKSLKLAEETAKEYNEQRGISHKDALMIVLGSMALSNRQR